jgi:histidinol-phosphatase (PHP family)
MDAHKIDLDTSEWRVSLHGGHSGEFCDHAQGTLREMLEAAVTAGYHTFGVSEHVPRPDPFLYPEERARGWTAEKVADDFNRYTIAISALAEEFADRMVVLRGFEAEVVPTASYAAEIREIRGRTLPGGRPAFDYFVGSVHFVEEQQIDGPPENYVKAVEVCGGIEALAVRYYDTIAEMVEALRPDVVGHLDLIKKNLLAAGYAPNALETPAVHAAVDRALTAIRAASGILDLNTAGWRKGLGEPYPAPWLVRRAHEMEIPFCFGDDSHRPADVGAGVDAARAYLLANGVDSVTVLTREADRLYGPIIRRAVSLLPIS